MPEDLKKDKQLSTNRLMDKIPVFRLFPTIKFKVDRFLMGFVLASKQLVARNNIMWIQKSLINFGMCSLKIFKDNLRSISSLYALKDNLKSISSL